MRFKVTKNTYIYLFIIMIILAGVSIYIEKKHAPSIPIIPEIDYAESNIIMAKNAIEQAKGRLNYQVNVASTEVFNTEAIKLIKEKKIDDIAEKTLDPFTQMAELAKTKRKTYVNLKESDLDKKIAPNPSSFERLKVMEYDVSSSTSNASLIYAPCDFAIFKTSPSWESFKSLHKIRNDVKVDFSKENIIVIVSKSELPPGIFKIDNVIIQGDVAIVNYRVDVLEMAEDNPNAKTNFYSATTVLKKVKSIRLNQVR
ncbi:MAG: hypothetical protein N2Z20_00740 [Elusimicrobiales bacterium]|nr:hypothetical protein [Elusimicrobiales bacterium]